MSWLLRLYPPSWRRRYGDEVAAHLAQERPSLRLGFDLLAGAIDARLHPEWTPTAASNPEEDPSMTVASRLCSRSGSMSRADALKSAAGQILGTLALVLLANPLETVSPAAGQTLRFSSWLIAFIVFYFQWAPLNCSRASRIVLQVGLSVVVVAILFASVVASESI